MLFFKIIVFFPFSEEILWRFFMKDNVVIESENPRITKMKDLIVKIPPYLLPKHYSKLELILIKDNKATAYAALGGRILVTTGLLDKVSDKTLFFVISHEMSHLTRRDHIYEFSRFIAKKYYFLLLRSNLVLELLQAYDQEKIEMNEALSDQYAFNIIDLFFKNKAGITEEIGKLRDDTK